MKPAAAVGTRGVSRRVAAGDAREANVPPKRAARKRIVLPAHAGGAIGLLIRHAWNDALANANRWFDSEDAEALHRVRVALRRLLAISSMAGKRLPAGAVDGVRRQSREIAATLGTLRDLDVFAGELLPSIEAARDAKARPALRTLRVATTRRLAAARREARQFLSRDRLDRLGNDVATLALACAESRDERMSLPAKRFARSVLKRRHRRVAAPLDELATLDDGERHELRIAAKKLRYAAEGFGALYPKRRYDAYRRALADLQTALGRIRDSQRALALARDIDPSSPALETLAAWAESCRNTHEDELSRAARRVRMAERFWKRKA